MAKPKPTSVGVQKQREQLDISSGFTKFGSIPVGKLSKTRAKKELAQLEDLIEQARHDYYVKDSPSLTDANFDRLCFRTSTIERRFPDLKELFSPNFMLGSAESNFRALEAAPLLHELLIFRSLD